MSFFVKIFGDPNQRVINQLKPLVQKINSFELEFERLPDEELKNKTLLFKERFKNKETLDDLLPEAFAVVREAAKRTLKQRHFDVQLMGGIVLHRGQIAEMKTGEGKTLVATLPLYLNAIKGEGCHLITVNDYLARRDAEWMGPIYDFLGLSVGVLNHEKAYLYQPKKEGRITNLGSGEELLEVPRKEAYLADITYGTNNEFGFDYLRDNMVYQIEDLRQRSLNYAIIDEVDSILIDEARTPLIISSPAEESANLYYQLARLVEPLKENRDYNIDEKMKTVALTEKGQEKVIKSLGVDPWQLAGSTDLEKMEKGLTFDHHLTAALRAKALFQKDKDYVIKNGEVVIVDEFTGRLMFGRRYSEGLHQAIEAREHEIGRHQEVVVRQESKTLATITFQNYFRLYQKLAGMTGTAVTEAEEFYKIYQLEVVEIPTHKPMIRQDWPDRIYANEKIKFKAVIKEIKERYKKGQPVLVGTLSIEKNELLSELLNREGIPHQILNAKNHEKESQIIAQAGQIKAVTVATNMAGRGVDIILGGIPPSKSQILIHQLVEKSKFQANEMDFDEKFEKWQEEHRKVVALGGLHVIGTERHESRRIDNQLRGRAGRQGDPGSSQFFVSMEDDLMRIFGGEKMKRLMEKFHFPEEIPIENKIISRSVEAAQKKVESHNFDIRKHLLDYDDVLNKHREAIYRKRKEILEISEKEKFYQIVSQLIKEEIEEIVNFHTASELGRSWNFREIQEIIPTIFTPPVNWLEKFNQYKISFEKQKLPMEQIRKELIDYLVDLAKVAYQELETKIDQLQRNLTFQIGKMLFLRTSDTFWIYHLGVMENLKGGIGLRAYGQKDPLVEYKRESYLKFQQLTKSIRKQFVYSLFKISVTPESIERSKKTTSPKLTELEKRKWGKVGRNKPCPCGSGKKYKKCCAR